MYHTTVARTVLTVRYDPTGSLELGRKISHTFSKTHNRTVRTYNFARYRTVYSIESTPIVVPPRFLLKGGHRVVSVGHLECSLLASKVSNGYISSAAARYHKKSNSGQFLRPNAKDSCTSLGRKLTARRRNQR